MTETSKPITDAAELLRLAADPNVALASVSGEVLKVAIELIDSSVYAAEQAGGRQMVVDLRRLRGIAGVLAKCGADGSGSAKRAQALLAGIANDLNDNRLLWLLSSQVMTPEQLATVNAAIAP